MEKMLDDVRRDAIAKLKEAEETASKKEQKLLVEAAMDVMTLHYVACGEGMHALEEKAKIMESEFLKTLIVLAANGMDFESAAEIATNEYWMEAPDGTEAMIDYIYIRGVLGILEGESEQVLTEILQTLIPKNRRLEYRVQVDKWEKVIKTQHRKEISDKFARIHPPVFQNTDLLHHISVLEKEILILTDKSMKRVMREMEERDLAVCVYALWEKVQRKILDNLGTRVVTKIMEIVVSLAPVSEEEVSDSITKMLSVIEVLQRRGALQELYESYDIKNYDI
ncbi:MAG: hypothetical protein HFG80_12385 [Eubacterium sp.]|jgi:Flagellar motor switch protein|nr:hypothetical protein [Eubacterium sp.]